MPSGTRLSLNRHVWTFVSNARYIPFVKERDPGFSAGPLQDRYVCVVTSKEMVGLGGLEPPASPLSGVRSNHLSYRPVLSRAPDGGASRDRTDDPLLAKQVLSQLSYGPIAPFPAAGLTLGCRSLVRTPGRAIGRPFVSKGGDPAAPSDTATLLRLHPSHESHRGNRPPEG